MDKRRKTPGFLLFCIFVLVIAGVVLVLYTIRSKGPFASHKITYSDSITEAEKEALQNFFNENKPSSDLNLSAKYSATFDKSDSAIYTAYLPVSGFYNPNQSVESSKLITNSGDIIAKIVDDPSKISPEDTTIYLLPVDKLNNNIKLLSIDDHYFLDEAKKDDLPSSGVIFRVIDIESDNQDAAKKSAESLTNDYKNKSSLPSKDSLLSLNQTGVTALTRKMQTRLNATGDAHAFAAKIADFLKSTDYTHTSNEVSFAKDCTNKVDMAFCSDYRMFDVLEDIGVDIVELTGNHNNDWGASANIDTINFYHDHNIKTVGGGKNEEEAKEPLKLSDKNTNITLIAVNNSTSTKANGQGASGDHPGANIYDEDTVKNQIKEAKAAGDFVIVDIQFFECYSYPDDGEEMPSCDLPITNQASFFKSLADTGADLIVGTQAHQPQTYELYGDKAIYYGLGNLFFDQAQWPGTSRSLVLTHYFKDGKLLQTKVTPTMYDQYYQTAVMDEKSAVSYLDRLTSYYRD